MYLLLQTLVTGLLIHILTHVLQLSNLIDFQATQSDS